MRDITIFNLMKIVFIIQITMLLFLSACTDEIKTQKEVPLKDSDLLVVQTKDINGTIKAGNYSSSKRQTGRGCDESANTKCIFS